jgi:hypothetical protein
MRESFEIHLLAAAVKATFDRRNTEIPVEPPLALTTDFSVYDGKSAQWYGFVKRNRITSVPEGLDAVVRKLSQFASPVFEEVIDLTGNSAKWEPGGPWRRES